MARLIPPSPGLFRDILLDPERERIPEALPLVSYHSDDDTEFLGALDPRARSRVHLRRRGRDHGDLVVLEPAGLLPPRPRRRRREVEATQRWRAGRPVFLPGIYPPKRGLGREVSLLHERFEGAGDLAAWLTEQRLTLIDDAAEHEDPERDLARCLVASEEEKLWVKLGRLSTHPQDRSLRLRVGFGGEGADDASRDEPRHRAVAGLGRGVLPGAKGLLACPELIQAVELIAELRTYATQPIAYWNAPDGGARFHHDAFAEQAQGGQRGVLYWQGSGCTLWLALSIQELAQRLREFLAWLGEGLMPWLPAELGTDLAVLTNLAGRRELLLAELALPDCGRFGPLVDRGPEFSCFLVDAGHGLILQSGDVLLLPNHGLDRTAMHSVFHAGDEIAYGLSFALREDLR